jgi:hypothetical protein
VPMVSVPCWTRWSFAGEHASPDDAGPELVCELPFAEGDPESEAGAHAERARPTVAKAAAAPDGKVVLRRCMASA